MKLTNQSPAAADLVVFSLPDANTRLGMVAAKLTFCYSRDGEVELDSEDPYPLLTEDRETELGLLPCDGLPRMDRDFEVVVLGRAHAPEGEAMRSMRVSLSVGTERRELMVFGDRSWSGAGGEVCISEPEPFEVMPLTYERAFGGSCEVLIDREAPVDVCHMLNPAGRGFDPAPMARGLAATLNTPEGYPRHDASRLLPNLEDPDALICAPGDDPAPACWATVPLNSGLQALRGVEVNDAADLQNASARFTSRLYHRAHPTWVIDPPAAMAEVTMVGLDPDQPITRFFLPALDVAGDWMVGQQHGTYHLWPQALVLLPEQRRFYLVYRCTFPVLWRAREERSMRLRVEEGWFPDTMRREAE